MDTQPIGDLIAYRAALLDADGVEHAAFARAGGVSPDPFASLNIGGTVGDDPAHVHENLRRICRALAWPEEQIVSGHQVHGDRVHVVVADDVRGVIASTDALVCNIPGILLLGRYADCVPVLLYDPVRQAVGLAHAGWRGTIRGIAAKSLRAMSDAYGSRATDVRAVIGPSIGPCCFEVGEKVLAAFSAQRAEVTDVERGCVDLWRANALQLEDAGVTRIAVAGHCTACQVGQFYSHRRENGETGRFAVVIGLRAQ